MAIQIYPDHDSLSLHVANEIAAQIIARPDSVLCLAAGDTPRRAYQLLAAIVEKEHVDCTRCAFVGLDEWLKIAPGNEGSCSWFLNTHIFTPLSIAPSQIRVFDGMATDLNRHCKEMDAFIQEKGGIDLMLVGVGMNGHIGFNEPGVREDNYSHVVELDATTREIGQKYFKEPTRLQGGITLGLQHFLKCRRAILMASGRQKASIIRSALQGDVDTKVPASIIRKHRNGVVMLDEEAAAELAIT